MIRMLSLILTILLLAGAAALTTGCKKEEPSAIDKLGDKVEKTTDEAAKKADEAAKKAGEALEDLDN